jgi:2-keto-4-pentenoate hydratase/2-oxohepta-3-ene-1,7-dioic acid hydratase in catechol pathway
MIERWLRFHYQEAIGFGTLEGEKIRVYEGDMFNDPAPTHITMMLAEVKLLMPAVPGQVLAMWNNFRSLGQALGLAAPAAPQYLLKKPVAYANPNETLRKPPCGSPVVFDGELGIVIGRECRDVAESAAHDYIFGYTCANDAAIQDKDGAQPQQSFEEWARVKQGPEQGNAFCPIGPVIATGLDPAMLVVRSMLNGQARQDYPVNDMIFSAAQLVSLISREMTLHPGDIILCGTSAGAAAMPPGSLIEIEIDGIGKLSNRFA